MQNKEQIVELLTQTGIQYTLVEHPAVYTIEEMLALHLPHFETVAKNLFVRDAKKRNYYLLVAPHDKQVNLTDFARRAGTTRLSFASQEDLQEILGLYSGAVSLWYPERPGAQGPRLHGQQLFRFDDRSPPQRQHRNGLPAGGRPDAASPRTG